MALVTVHVPRVSHSPSTGVWYCWRCYEAPSCLLRDNTSCVYFARAHPLVFQCATMVPSVQLRYTARLLCSTAVPLSIAASCVGIPSGPPPKILPCIFTSLMSFPSSKFHYSEYFNSPAGPHTVCYCFCVDCLVLRLGFNLIVRRSHQLRLI